MSRIFVFDIIIKLLCVCIMSEIGTANYPFFILFFKILQTRTNSNPIFVYFFIWFFNILQIRTNSNLKLT